MKDIDYNKIIYIKACRMYSYLYMSDGKEFVLRKTLYEWENELSAKEFIRVHRSYIVNQVFILSIKGNTLILLNDHKINIAVRRKKEVIHILGK